MPGKGWDDVGTLVDVASGTRGALAGAIEAAAPGSTLLLRDGWHEAAPIRKPLRLVGAQGEQAVIIVPEGADLEVDAPGPVTLRNLAVIPADGPLPERGGRDLLVLKSRATVDWVELPDGGGILAADRCRVLHSQAHTLGAVGGPWLDVVRCRIGFVSALETPAAIQHSGIGFCHAVGAAAVVQLENVDAQPGAWGPGVRLYAEDGGRIRLADSVVAGSISAAASGPGSRLEVRGCRTVAPLASEWDAPLGIGVGAWRRATASVERSEAPVVFGWRDFESRLACDGNRAVRAPWTAGARGRRRVDAFVMHPGGDTYKPSVWLDLVENSPVGPDGFDPYLAELDPPVASEYDEYVCELF